MLKFYIIGIFIMLCASSRACAQITDTIGRDYVGDVFNYFNSAITWLRIPTFVTCSPDFDLKIQLTGFAKQHYAVQSSNTAVISVNGDVLHIVGSGQVNIIIESFFGLSGNSESNLAQVKVTVADPPQPYVDIDTGYTTSCDGKTLIFTTETNYINTAQYLWQVNGVGNDTGATFSSSTLKNNDVLTCSITVPNNCYVPVNDTLIFHPRSVSVNIKQRDSSMVCTGALLSILATPVNIAPTLVTSYQWQVNGNVITSANSTVLTYIFKNNDAVSCVMTYRNGPSCTQTQNVTANPLVINVKSTLSPIISISTSDNPICPSGASTFTVTATNNTNAPVYQWLVNGKNAGSNSLVFTSTFKDNDTVACAISTSDCTAPILSKPVIIKWYEAPVISLSKAMNVILGKGGQLNPIIKGNIASYNWSPVSGLSNDKIPDPVVTPVNTTTYTLSVVSVDGCKSQASITVDLIVPIIVPNTFTPNGDGTNDVWDIPSLTYYPRCTVSVYNRYGIPVLRSSGYTKPWDGTFNGKPLPIGTYYYVINSDQAKGVTVSGPVTIIR